MRPPLLPLLVLASLAAPVVSQRTSPATRGVPGSVDGIAPPGLVAWWRADAGLTTGISNLVATWEDQSGNGWNLTQDDGHHKPVSDRFGYEGSEALVFDGSDFVSRPDGLPPGSYSSAVAFVVDDLRGGGTVLGGLGGHRLHFKIQSPLARLTHGTSFIESTVPVTPGELVVLVATWDSASGIGSLYQDGVPVAAGLLAAPGDQAIQIGASFDGIHLHGRVSETMLFDHELTDPERAAVESYLLTKYAGTGFPEVDFTALPRNARLFQRDGKNEADVRVEGEVQTAGFDAVVLRVLRDGSLFATSSQPLAYSEGKAPFSVGATIDAGLFSYDVGVFLKAGATETQVAQRENLVCGDAFLIDGQSNAAAKDWHDEGVGNQSQSNWIRSFGTGRYYLAFAKPVGTPFGSGMVSKLGPITDLNWDLAEGLIAHKHASVGQWALRMAEVILQDQGVPVALINGSVEGSKIQFHRRHDFYPEDPTTIYGRLLTRTKEAGVHDGVRGLIFYQGESNGGEGELWGSTFAEIRADWLSDYPSLERIFVFQIREGCSKENQDVREVQRQLDGLYPDVRLMSTTAVPTHDGCHYFYAGYREIGDRIARLLQRELYGATPGSDVDPPQIVSAAWTSPAKNQLLLTFKEPADTLVFDAGAEADFDLDDGTTVVAGSALGNTLLLDLSGTSTATTISWIGHQGDGPWIANANGVGALTFFDFPITP